MKLIKLLEGLYQELKTYNEFARIAQEEKRQRENPCVQGTDIEIRKLKQWVYKCCKEKQVGDERKFYLADRIAGHHAARFNERED